MITSALVLASFPAAAEVCDKLVGESWRPDQGPAWLFNPFFPQLVVWAIIAVGITLTALLRRRWVGYMAAILCLLVVGVILMEPPPGDPVRIASVRDGCAAALTMTLDAAIAAALATACIVLGHVVSRRRVAS
jgi:hypothetical protein